MRTTFPTSGQHAILDSPDVTGATHAVPPPVGKGKRLVNLLVDYGVRFALGNALVTSATWLLGGEALAVAANWIYQLLPASELTVPLAYGCLVEFAYYACCEGGANGRTLGKLLTGTRAVRDDGEAFTIRDAIKRSLWRLAPLETVTFLVEGNSGWHDERTGTRVVDVRG